MTKSGGKRYGKHYMTGCSVGTYVNLECCDCKNTITGHYGRIPKTCRKCGGLLVDKKTR